MPKPITPQSVILNSKPIQNHLLRLESLKFIIKNFMLIITPILTKIFPFFFHCLIYCYPLQ